MATLNFNLSLQKSGSYSINAIVRDPSIRDRLKCATGHSLPHTRYWNKDKQRVKEFKEAYRINERLIEMETLFHNYVDERDRFKLAFNPVDIVRMFTGKSTRNPALYLTDLYLDFMDSLELTHKAQTIKKYEVMYHQLLEYEVEHEVADFKITLPGVTLDFYEDLAGWLIARHNNVNKTILRKLKNIRTVMKYGTKQRKYWRGDDWEAKLNLQDVEASKVPLDMSEILAFRNFTTTDLTKRMICDAFLTAMYTGLRYSDLQQLSDVHFHKSGDITFINLNMTKTMNQTSIPVPDFLLQILKPYRKHKDRLFRLGENSLSNRLLKGIAKDLKLERAVEVVRTQGSLVEKTVETMQQAISFHFGRYTYIYLLDTGGLQATYIQLNVGHRDLETTQDYLQSDTHRRMHTTLEVLNKVVGQ